jgi:hypothetical protein
MSPSFARILRDISTRRTLGGWCGSMALAAAAASACLLLSGQPGWAQQTGVTQHTCCTVVINGPAVAVKVTRPGMTAKETFAGKAGQRVSAVVSKVVTSDNGCETLTLVEPGGTIVTSSSNCGSGNPVGIGPADLTVTGTYTVKFTVDTTATGSGKLTVSAPVTVGPVTVNGSSVGLNVSRAGQGVQRTFTAKTGQRVSAAITQVVTSDNGCETLTLLGPGGGTVTSASNCGNGNPVGIGPVNLTVTGTYTVRLEIDNTATGTSTLWVSTPKTVGTVAINGPAVSLDTTRVGQGVQRTFTAKTGQRVAAAVTQVVTSDNGCETLTLIDPGGSTVTSSSNCGNGNPVGIGPASLTVTGTYTIRLEIDNTATGTSKLWLSAPVTVGTVTINGPAVSLNVTRVAQGVQRTFTGKAGQQITAVGKQIVTSDNGCETLTLLAPGGGTVTSGSNCGNGNPVSLGPVKLSVSGTYKIRLEIDTTATGTSKLTVST